MLEILWRGLGRGLVDRTSRPLFLLPSKASSCNLANELFYCSTSFETQNYVLSFRMSELNRLKDLLIQTS